MKKNDTLYFDCPAGISGDMTLGALLDAGADFNILQKQLTELNLNGYSIQKQQVKKHDIAATKVNIAVTGEQPHRHLSDIKQLLSDVALPVWVKEKALTVFTLLAEAEAKIHAIPAAHIHFHEIGAVDSLLDITGSLLLMQQLQIKHFYCSPLPVSRGFVRCQHGLIPLPAPAALELLQGMPTIPCSYNSELITPTGAALIKALVDNFRYPSDFTIETIGYGAGTHDLPIPNVLRIMIGTTNSSSANNNSHNNASALTAMYETDEVFILESNIDDQNPQLYQQLLGRLLQAGALDVFLIPGIMKKNRPGIQLQVIVPEKKLPEVCQIILSESSAIGLRYRREQRLLLHRRSVPVLTDYGTVAIKIAFAADNPHKAVNITPEYDDCLQLAQRHNVPVKIVQQAALAAAYSQLTL